MEGTELQHDRMNCRAIAEIKMKILDVSIITENIREMCIEANHFLSENNFRRIYGLPVKI